VYGKEAGGSLEPARQAHIDYSNTGLRSTARYRRQDITKLAEKALKAEDSANAGESVAVPRYAVYSVWVSMLPHLSYTCTKADHGQRPVEEVRRDPLAVCDVRSANRSEWEASSVRAISNVTKNGEYHLQSLLILPPREPDQQKWYWAPHQRPDEVLIVKAADTAADEDSTISPGCPHVSPIVPGTESEPPRCSIECRVIAFWE
jgi:GA4 desaturase